MAVALVRLRQFDFDSPRAWFAKPFDVVGRNGGYTYSELQETKSGGADTANDLVNANGSCPAPAVAPAPPAGAGPATAGAGAGRVRPLHCSAAA